MTIQELQTPAGGPGPARPRGAGGPLTRPPGRGREGPGARAGAWRPTRRSTPTWSPARPAGSRGVRARARVRDARGQAEPLTIRRRSRGGVRRRSGCCRRRRCWAALSAWQRTQPAARVRAAVMNDLMGLRTGAGVLGDTLFSSRCAHRLPADRRRGQAAFPGRAALLSHPHGSQPFCADSAAGAVYRLVC